MRKRKNKALSVIEGQIELAKKAFQETQTALNSQETQLNQLLWLKTQVEKAYERPKARARAAKPAVEATAAAV